MSKRGEASKNPYDTIFWNDLENDEKLKTCSLAAKGLWTCHLLPIAARSAERGVVIVGNWPSRLASDLPGVLANVVGGSPDIIAALLDELVNSGAASVDDEGRIYNRRMVKKYHQSQVRSAAGKRGAQSRWEKSDSDPSDDATARPSPNGKPMANGMANGMAKSGDESREQPIEEKDLFGTGRQGGGCEGDGKAMPSSIFGASNRENHTVDREGAKRALPKRAKASRATVLPKDWQPSEDLKTWTREAIAEAGATDAVKPGAELKKFRHHAEANGRTLKNWDAGWRMWITKAIEWSKPNGSSNRAQQAPHHTSLGRKARFAAAIHRLGARGSDTEGDGS